MSIRNFIGILVAFLADAIQIETTIVTFGAGLFAIPSHILFSVIVSITLAIIMKPNIRFLPSAVIELIPGMNLIPSFTAVALWVTFNTKKQI